MSAYQRSTGTTGTRRVQRPSSFSGTTTPRSRNIYHHGSSNSPVSASSSVTPSSGGSVFGGSGGVGIGYPYHSSSASWSPSGSSASTSFPSTLTTYGGTTSGYGGLTLPNPNSYSSSHGHGGGYSSYLNSYHHGNHHRASSPSYLSRSATSGGGIGKSMFDFPTTIPLSRPVSSSSLASSVRSYESSEGYAVEFGRCCFQGFMCSD